VAAKVRLTSELIKQTPLPPDGKRVTLYDSEVQDLGLRITSKGTRTWIFQKKIHGRAQKVMLGHWQQGGAGITVVEARRRATVLAGEIAKGDDPLLQMPRRTGRVPTLLEYFEGTWLELYGKINVESTTWQGKAGNFRRHVGPLGRMRMDAVKREDVQRVLVQMLESVKPRTANLFRSTLSQVYSAAIEDGVLPPDFRPPLPKKIKVSKYAPKFLNPAEVQLLVGALKVCQGGCSFAPRNIQGIVMLALLTGLRRRNILRLMWGQIDFNSQSIHIPAAEAKTRMPYHTRLSPEACEVLLALQKTAATDAPWVFPSPVDPMKPQENIKRAWNAVRVTAGMSDVRFHDLRHTFAANFLRATGNLKLLQEALHHNDIRTTANVYGHLLDEQQIREATQLASQLLLSQTPEKISAILAVGAG